MLLTNRLPASPGYRIRNKNHHRLTFSMLCAANRSMSGGELYLAGMDEGSLTLMVEVVRTFPLSGDTPR